jgi:hypothetical protein
VRGETQGAAYDMKTVVAAALLGKAGGSRDMAMEAVQRLANIATPDTLHFGEVFITTFPDNPNTPVFSQRVATPHVWEGTLFYLSAMALSVPQSFDPEMSELPLPPQPLSAIGGCNVPRSDPSNATSYATLALLAALASSRARRKRYFNRA